MQRPLLSTFFLSSLLAASCGGSKSGAGSGSDAGGGAGRPPDAATRVRVDSGAGSPLDASMGSPQDTGSPADANGASPPGDAGVDAGDYALASMWLCGANASPDYCLVPQAVTAIAPDLTQATSTPTPATDPALDCFYVYPSVDITSPPGNEANFDNLPDILDPVHSQAAPFSQVCKVYAPLYHQATYQSYFSADADTYLEIAYAGVAAAFHEYWTVYNHGRPFVLLGHSQGSHMLRRLIQRVVETTPAVENQMVLAVLAGTLGDMTVPQGQLVGGSFQHTPLCSSATERGCVYTFSSFAEGYPPTSSYPDFAVGPGMDVGCSNPAAPGGGLATLADTWFYTQYQNATLTPPQNTGVSTPFASYAKFYTGQCTPSPAGYSYFEINPAPGPGDQRTNPIPFGNLYYLPSILGLHLLDFAFPMGDLLTAVRTRAPAVDGGAHDAAHD